MNRRGLWLSGALFYAAPVGAGLTGASYFAALPFAGLFLLWVLTMRSQPFRDGAAFVLPTLMLYFALASMLLGLGTLLRAFAGVEATVPLLAWLVLGLGAIALGRLLWQPQQEAEMEAYLEKALKKLNEFADDAEDIVEQDPDLPLHHPTQAEAAALAVAYGQIDVLPAEAAPEGALKAILQPLDAEIRPHILHQAFLNRADRTGTRRDRQAALVLASDGALAWRALGEGRLAAVFDLIVAAADTATLAQFLVAANEMLEDFPTTHEDFPDVARLLDISGQIEDGHAELAEGLVRLANKLEDME